MGAHDFSSQAKSGVSAASSAFCAHGKAVQTRRNSWPSDKFAAPVSHLGLSVAPIAVLLLASLFVGFIIGDTKRQIYALVMLAMSYPLPFDKNQINSRAIAESFGGYVVGRTFYSGRTAGPRPPKIIVSPAG
jgi:hypothetical protein